MTSRPNGREQPEQTGVSSFGTTICSKCYRLSISPLQQILRVTRAMFRMNAARWDKDLFCVPRVGQVFSFIHYDQRFVRRWRRLNAGFSGGLQGPVSFCCSPSRKYDGSRAQRHTSHRRSVRRGTARKSSDSAAEEQRQHPSTRADILGELTGGGTVIYRFVSTSLALFRLSSECSAVILCC